MRNRPNRIGALDLRKADFGLFGRLIERVPWEVVLKGKGVQKDLAFFDKEILITGTGHPHSLKDKPAGKTILDEQRALFRTQESKESLLLLEGWPDNSGGPQGCCELMKEEN